jgi:hypothetical protein
MSALRETKDCGIFNIVGALSVTPIHLVRTRQLRAIGEKVTVMEKGEGDNRGWEICWWSSFFYCRWSIVATNNREVAGERKKEKTTCGTHVEGDCWLISWIIPQI